MLITKAMTRLTLILGVTALLSAQPAAKQASERSFATPQEAAHEIKHWFGKHPVYKYKRFGVDE